jgi:lysophospholipase L1-like esterase
MKALYLKKWLLWMVVSSIVWISNAAVEVPIIPGENGEIKNWMVRAACKTDVSCVRDGNRAAIRFNAPKKVVMISMTSKPIQLADFITVKVRARFKGKGKLKLGFHSYSKKGYCGTFPAGKKDVINSLDKEIDVETDQILGRYSDGYMDADHLPAKGYICVYAFPGTVGEISDFTYEVKKYQPDRNSLIANPTLPGVPPLQHRLVIPDTIYAVEGVETNVYFDNVFLSVSPGSYVFDVDCRKGNNFKKKWSFTPGKRDIGKYKWILRVIGKNGLVAKKEIKLVVAPADAGKGRKITLLMVGDSITDVTTFPKRVHALFQKNGNPELTMIGTRPAVAKNGSMAHEGYAGWAWNSFLKRGPFIVKKNGNPELDIPAYFAKYNNGIAPDFITIQLGVNDIFGSRDYIIYNTLYNIERNMDTLVNAFRKAAPNAVIGIGLPTPCASQDGMGRIYRCGQTKYQYTKNRLMLSEMVIRKYGKSADKKIFVIPMYNNLDCEHNFPMQEYPVNSGNPAKISMPKDGLHPAEPGGNQLGDTLYAWIKYQLSHPK